MTERIGVGPVHLTPVELALNDEIPQQFFDQMTAISDTVICHIPDFDNMFSYYP